MVLLILEIMMFVSGVYMLITGKTIGKDSVKHLQVRLLGILLACELPFVLFCGLALGIYIAITDPSAAKSGNMPTWFVVTSTIIEWSSYLIWAAIWSFWTKRIRAKFAPPPAPVETAELDPLEADGQGEEYTEEELDQYADDGDEQEAPVNR